MTTRWVALLRGIAPMHENQKSADLRGACEAAGFTRVASIQSSGNLVLDADTDDRDEVTRRLERTWIDRLGFTSRTIVRTPEELQALVDLQPYAGQEHGPAAYQLVTFFDRPITLDFAVPHEVESLGLRVVHATATELFTVNDTSVGKGTPSAMGWLQKTFGKDLTSRTFPTLSRILKKC